MLDGSCLRVFLGGVFHSYSRAAAIFVANNGTQKGKPGQEGTRPGRVGGKYARIDIVTDF